MKCITVDDDPLSRETIGLLIEKTPLLELVGSFPDEKEGMAFLEKEQVDIVFLDIEMPGMTGLEMIEQMDAHPEVILITSNESYAIKAFEYSVTDYLVKPVEFERFKAATDKAIENLQVHEFNRMSGDSFYIKTGSKIKKLNLQDIHFIEALADYVIINTEQKKYIVHSTMKALEKRLPEKMFCRVHRSYIISLKHIDTIEETGIITMTKKIPISLSYKPDFMKRLNFL